MPDPESSVMKCFWTRLKVQVNASYYKTFQGGIEIFDHYSPVRVLMRDSTINT